MCGIVGFIDFKKQSSEKILNACTDELIHRGPDGRGIAFFNREEGQVALGHRRLSIIDLSEAAGQPMEYNGLWIVFNGEIYNYKEIKKELVQAGHQFKAHSDTEVILHAWQQWGAAMLSKFIGMFAFVIYDTHTGSLFCCRDRAGVKPFFYYWKNDLFLFSSELKGMMKHPAFEKEIDQDALSAYMQFGYVPTPHCIFENCYKLKPGHYLQMDIKTRSFTMQQYWNVYDAYNKPVLEIGFDEAVAETEKLLTHAFQYRMVSDVPVGVFLSGGYDSSCVTAILQKNNSEKIKTFTIGVPDAGLNEAPYAKEIARHLGTDHTEYYCTQKEALEIVPDLPFYYDEPFADSSAIPTTLVSRVARKQVTVALSADAGDEIFAGYNRYDYMMRYGKKMAQLPASIRKLAAATMDKIPADKVPILRKKYEFHTRYEKVKSFLKNNSEKNILVSLTRHMTDEEIHKLFKNKVKKIETAFDSSELGEKRFTILDYIMAVDYQTYLVDDILQKVDRAGMSVSLEGREPFLDHRIIEWAAQLPSHFKYDKGKKKIILKEIVHKYIPQQIMDRPKMGFGIPLQHWLTQELKPFVDELFDDKYIEAQGIFNNAEIQRLRNSFYNGRVERVEKIWFILMFQMWYERWMK
ncbi:MAG: asparagine synthase (glutamine-hydrolyzing) [Niastella sp. SCN 39-18]|nr:asparagine synthase (glutamine-hydrolyzing) [Sphingobacteriales bacterium]ODT55007.1 MAG: asparagine synthase (glutamine-hydrolyzing) [Niastella sp. SCN 39-18]OJW08452.1 MAG: asparagine synthase (glutamine-hydrolyzing) [Sphingobacteriales bacterium 39-19]